jgi:hypothetical protein
LTEAHASVQHPRRKAFKTICIIAPPFHLARAFMTAVQAESHIFPPLQIYSIAGVPPPWNDTAVYSQGILSTKRYKLIGNVLFRINRCVAKKDLS